MIDKSILTEEQKQLIIAQALEIIPPLRCGRFPTEPYCDKVVCPYCQKEKVYNSRLNRKTRKNSFSLVNGSLHCGKCKKDFKFLLSEWFYDQGYEEGVKNTERKLLKNIDFISTVKRIRDYDSGG
jgi:hypothetical protein